MKRLLLLRHAEASDDDAFADFDRPLTRRGRRDAEKVGRRLRRRGAKISLVCCSPSARTRETLSALGAVPGAPEIRFADALYKAEAEDLTAIVAGLGSHARRVLVIGHNPGLEDFARRIADPAASRSKPLRRLEKGLAKAALASFRVEADDWSEFAKGRAALRKLRTPKSKRSDA